MSFIFQLPLDISICKLDISNYIKTKIKHIKLLIKVNIETNKSLVLFNIFILTFYLNSVILKNI